MIIIPQRQKEKSKTLVRNKTSSINDDNNNLDNKLISLSTTSLKKITSNSNVSLNFSKSINNNIINNNLKKRPLSSINIIRKVKPIKQIISKKIILNIIINHQIFKKLDLYHQYWITERIK